MEKSIFGVFTAALAWICLVCAIQCVRKKKFGLAILFFLCAITNVVNSIHAVYKTLF